MELNAWDDVKMNKMKDGLRNQISKKELRIEKLQKSAREWKRKQAESLEREVSGRSLCTLRPSNTHNSKVKGEEEKIKKLEKSIEDARQKLLQIHEVRIRGSGQLEVEVDDEDGMDHDEDDMEDDEFGDLF